MTRLVIAPHVDDDVLGCASLLDADTVTFYCGVDDHHVVSARARLAEAEAVAHATGGAFYWPGGGYSRLRRQWVPAAQMSGGFHGYEIDRRVVNHYDVPSLIVDLETVIEIERPDEVLIPWPSYNQDHRAVYEAALVALRPHDQNHRVGTVLVYEGSQVNFWDWAQPGAAFRPNYFVPFDFARKEHLYSLMPSQVRSFRSVEQLRALATVRGGEIGAEYAEAFMALRMVVGGGDD